MFISHKMEMNDAVRLNKQTLRIRFVSAIFCQSVSRNELGLCCEKDSSQNTEIQVFNAMMICEEKLGSKAQNGT